MSQAPFQSVFPSRRPNLGYIFWEEQKGLIRMDWNMGMCGKEKDQRCQKFVAQATGCLQTPSADLVEAWGEE